MANDTGNTASMDKLAAMIVDKDPETMRAGKRQLWQRVRHVGRPGNDAEQQAVVADLLKLTGKDQPAAVRREVIWAVSELAGDECVDPIAAMLADAELREDARLVLQRLPGEKALNAIKAGFKSAPDDFKVNLAESLRARGVTGLVLPADEKLGPCRQTKLTPVGR